jgi:hypothetical protein
MSYEMNAQYSSENIAAYALRKSVMRNCQASNVVELLDLADDLHALIRVRRSEARRVFERVAARPPLVTATAVFLD